MNVLITGSSGYIGSVLAQRMREANIKLFGCDNNLTGSYATDTFIRHFKISFDDPFVVRHVIQYKIDAIVHLAATSTVGPDATNPLDYYENNAARTITFVKRLKDAGWTGHIIFASTAAVYASSRKPVTEDFMIEPLGVYGHSKYMCEQVLNMCRIHGIKVTSFRFFNVAGAYNGLGEEKEDTHLISKICSSVLNNKELTVYGDDYPTHDGTCVRDYVHVCDISNAITLAIERGIEGTYNLGTKRGTSVKEIIDQFELYTERKVKWNVGPRRPGDQPFLVTDSTEYEKKSGFKYSYSLKDIINSSWEHFKNGI
jgi:UDP-glucose 4-epimerase